ncbi:hypothetical protein L596_030309 [Steinernema carpocapsae]|uniref:Uncharacterized protein n=1 Tax=Steinernema carpocapsae TaxID=34508 RepID=A0A4U5LP02_STECR|nr:hypothetical protein L596_030309 [Steinernema carpocapsae]
MSVALGILMDSIFMGLMLQNFRNLSLWPVPSRPPASRPEERLPASSWPPRPLASRLPQPEASRSLIATVPEPLLSVRSVATRSRLSFSSASSPSSVLSVRSPKTSRLTSVFSRLPSALFRKPLRPTSSVSSKTPTCAPSMPSESPSCPRTSSLLAAFAENALKRQERLDRPLFFNLSFSSSCSCDSKLSVQNIFVDQQPFK